MQLLFTLHRFFLTAIDRFYYSFYKVSFRLAGTLAIQSLLIHLLVAQDGAKVTFCFSRLGLLSYFTIGAGQVTKIIVIFNSTQIHRHTAHNDNGLPNTQYTV